LCSSTWGEQAVEAGGDVRGEFLAAAHDAAQGGQAATVLGGVGRFQGVEEDAQHGRYEVGGGDVGRGEGAGEVGGIAVAVGGGGDDPGAAGQGPGQFPRGDVEATAGHLVVSPFRAGAFPHPSLTTTVPKELVHRAAVAEAMLTSRGAGGGHAHFGPHAVAARPQLLHTQP
jgi:hypothetical protein